MHENSVWTCNHQHSTNLTVVYTHDFIMGTFLQFRQNDSKASFVLLLKLQFAILIKNYIFLLFSSGRSSNAWVEKTRYLFQQFSLLLKKRRELTSRRRNNTTVNAFLKEFSWITFKNLFLNKHTTVLFLSPKLQRNIFSKNKVRLKKHQLPSGTSLKAFKTTIFS